MFATYTLRQDLEKTLGNQQFETTSFVASLLDRELDKRFEALKEVALRIGPVIQKGPAATQTFLDQWLSLKTLLNADIIVVDVEGNRIATAPYFPEHPGDNLMDRDYIAGPLKDGAATIGKPVVGKTSRTPSFGMGVPIRDHQGRVIGVLGAATNLAAPNFLDQIPDSRYGKSGGYSLISRQHRLIVTASEKGRIMNELLPLGKNPVMDRYVGGHEGSAIYVNTRGVEVLSSAKSIPSANWLLVATLPTSEAFAPVLDLQLRMLVATVFLTLLASWLTWRVLGRQLMPVLTAAQSLSAQRTTNRPLQPLPIGLNDEVGQLIGGFNSLLKTVEEHEAELRKSEAHYRLLTEDVADVVWELNADYVFTYISPADERMRGYTSKEVLGQHFSSVLTEDSTRKVRELVQDRKRAELEGIQTGTKVIVLQQRCKDGSTIWAEVHTTPVRDVEGTIIGYHGISRNITERRAAEETVRIRELYQRMLLDNFPFKVWLKDKDSRILAVNQAYANTCNVPSPDLLRGKSNYDFSCAEQAAVAIADDQEVLASGQPKIVEELLFIDGRDAWFETYKSPIIIDGNAVGTLGFSRDITERKLSERRINELAFYDQLTGLPNRTLLLDRLKQSMNMSLRTGQFFALLLIDLDNFKTLNDTLGHDMGDLLLTRISKRLVGCVRLEDTVARFGGDEFIVILTSLGLDESIAASQTEFIGKKIIAALNETNDLNGHSYFCTPSIGAILSDGQHTSIDFLLKQTDIAMYRAKKEGGNALRFFDSEMEVVVMKRATLEQDLRIAIQEEQFVLHYQVQVSSGRMIGAEVLVRWRHAERGLVSPAEFIPMAEDTGLIIPLGAWVLEVACRQLAAWSIQPEMNHLSVAVNVSARQFHQRDFVDQVLSMLDKTGANPNLLKLELTESLLLSNIDETIQKMFALRAKGVGFSLDDFGTGYSSLIYLKRLPLDQLKIDQSFVRDVLIDPNDASIARTIISLAHSLGLGVIAEGVETQAQRDFLASAGCDSYQGYFFSRPLSSDDFHQLVSGNTTLNSQTEASC